ncbi:MAG: transcriptional repressor [Planctomycetota bacterium]|nr:transcriptional repressor [Planctomycetota bacterium]
MKGSGEAAKRLESFLRSRGLRLTRGRRLAVEAVEACGAHFGIEDVDAAARAKGLRVHRATIYRAVPLLVEAGILRKVSASGGDRGEYEKGLGREHHDHLLCLDCGRSIEVSSAAMEREQARLCAQHGFLAVDHQLRIRGYCAVCRSGGRPRATSGPPAPIATGAPAGRPRRR